MANITLGQVRDYWKAVSDWVTGASASKPRVVAVGISSSPVTGVKTVTSTAAELFAGSSRKSGRTVMTVRNVSNSIRIRIGPSGVTDVNGFSLEPGDAVELNFDPAVVTPIYAVSEAGNAMVEVFES